MNVLTGPQWRQQATEHAEAVGPWLTEFKERRKRRKPHPVHDFLFIYYRYSPAKLLQWHPGIGFLLEGAQFDSKEQTGKRCGSPTAFSRQYYSIDEQSKYSSRETPTIFCDPRKITASQHERMEWSYAMLSQTAARPGNYGCFGLHEWAMVYRGQDIRHDKTAPLRLSQSEIDSVVQDLPIACSHFDAFRFFAADAKSLNVIQPTVHERATFEQPACIHANMDLYKWAFKAMPWLGSDLLLKCFYLARDAREVDMRASPYDLTGYGIRNPICVETESGRVEYKAHQKVLADRAKILRQQLIDRLCSILSTE